MNNIRLLTIMCSSIGLLILLILLNSITIAVSIHPQDGTEAPTDYYLSDLAPPPPASQEAKQIKSISPSKDKPQGMSLDTDDLKFLILGLKILIAVGFGWLVTVLLVRLVNYKFGLRKQN